MADTVTSINTADVLAIDAAVLQSTGTAQFGITQDGFVAKPFARVLAEKLALARSLFGDAVDLTSGSAIRKLLEISALEDARTWSSLAAMYDNNYVVSATGNALSCLGEEIGIARPFLEAHGTVKLKLAADLPNGYNTLTIPRGARMLTAGGHHVATDETAIFSSANRERQTAVVAFYPGPEHNLNPAAANANGGFPQKINAWNQLDGALDDLFNAEAAAGKPLVTIEHTQPLSGGELQWPDERYRRLLLQAPRSLWTVDAIRIAVSLVPGVRQVQVHDAWGGLDINQSIFGNFNFIERLFSSERDLGSPYYFTVLVAPTEAAIWDGPDGLRAAVESSIEDLRPIGIFPQIQEATQVVVGVEAKLIIKGLPLPTGTPDTVNNSGPALALKARLRVRMRQYIDALGFGEPVRAAEVTWALMNEPGVADVLELKLLKYPPDFTAVDFASANAANTIQKFGNGTNIPLQTNEVPVFADIDTGLRIS